MTITINGTTGITNDGGYTGDGVVFADTTPANTLVTTTGGNVGIGTGSPANFGAGYINTQINGVTGSFLSLAVNGTRTGYMYSDASGTEVGNLTNGYYRFIVNGSERARIDSSGNLLVGTTSSAKGSSGTVISAGSAQENIRLNGTSPQTFITFNLAGSTVGSISASGSTTTYATSSDYRLKENILPMAGALSVVQQLKPVTYKWKVDGSDGQGFIAHELQEVCPDAVTGEKDAVDAEGNPRYQGIDTSFLVATLTAAIQEQQAIILAQESALNALTARVAALEGK